MVNSLPIAKHKVPTNAGLKGLLYFAKRNERNQIKPNQTKPFLRNRKEVTYAIYNSIKISYKKIFQIIILTPLDLRRNLSYDLIPSSKFSTVKRKMAWDCGYHTRGMNTFLPRENAWRLRDPDTCSTFGGEYCTHCQVEAAWHGVQVSIVKIAWAYKEKFAA